MFYVNEQDHKSKLRQKKITAVLSNKKLITNEIETYSTCM